MDAPSVAGKVESEGPGAILTTKLHIPQARSTLVPRPNLKRKLDEGLACKLTLICAPAGFGKTTLLSDWLAGNDRPAAWLSLDQGDNDPARFLAHLIAAVQTLQSDIGQTLWAALQSSQLPSLEPLLIHLINELSAKMVPFSLVLDDYHLIKDAPIHDSLAFLLEHLPQSLHLVIASRTDPPLPLARLRARGDLNEVRAAELRFTPEEAAAFLNGVMGLNLSAENIAALEERTEGWIAGLQLAALSMRGRSDLDSFITAFTGSHRHILDYLSEEVLNRQPEHVRTFLLCTAILERLTAPLCDAVTEGDDGDLVLEHLERANLFLIPLDEERRWYRYHHLFAEALRARLRQTKRDSVSALHHRAAHWYEREGLISEAVEHALAAGDFEHAARITAASADDFWAHGQLTLLLGWLQRLPQGVMRSQPRLLLVLGWTRFLLHSYDTEGVETILKRAELALKATGAPAERGELAKLQGILTAIRTAVASTQEDAPRTIALAHEALDHLPADDARWRMVPMVSLGLAYDAQGDARAANKTLTEAVTLSHAAGNKYLAQVATMNLARVRIVQGQLRAAAELCERALEMAAQAGGYSPITSYPYVALGRLRYEWNDLEGAAYYLQKGIEQAGLDEHLRALLDGSMALACVKQALGDVTGAQAMSHSAKEAAGAATQPWAEPLVAAQRARLAVQQGNLAEALSWADEAGLRVDDEPTYPKEFAHKTFAKLLAAQGKPDEALRLLEALLQAAEAAGRRGSAVELMTLQALALQAQGATQRALAVLGRALALAQAEGYARTFIDEGEPMAALLRVADYQNITPGYVTTLLAAFPPTAVPEAASSGFSPQLFGLVEPLSERELAILRLMSGRLSDKEIAKALSLSVNTIKWYSSRLFTKMNVHKRSEAVARAKTLDLL